MTDEEYEAFKKWWKTKWAMSSPDRASAELYQVYLDELQKQKKKEGDDGKV